MDGWSKDDEALAFEMILNKNITYKSGVQA